MTWNVLESSLPWVWSLAVYKWRQKGYRKCLLKVKTLRFAAWFPLAWFVLNLRCACVLPFSIRFLRVSQCLCGLSIMRWASDREMLILASGSSVQSVRNGDRYKAGSRLVAYVCMVPLSNPSCSSFLYGTCMMHPPSIFISPGNFFACPCF